MGEGERSSSRLTDGWCLVEDAAGDGNVELPTIGRFKFPSDLFSPDARDLSPADSRELVPSTLGSSTCCDGTLVSRVFCSRFESVPGDASFGDPSSYWTGGAEGVPVRHAMSGDPMSPAGGANASSLAEIPSGAGANLDFRRR